MILKLPWQKDKLVYPLVRVDDRLLHGQVIVGWGQTLDLDLLILASDRVVKDEPALRIYAGLIPEEMHGEVLSLTETAERWVRGDLDGKKAMIVVEAPVDALKLFRLGAPLKVLTIGGLHFREEREELLPYVYLSEWDRTTLGELRKEGVKIRCQDLPTAQPVAYED
ncbi:PTS sugar transporter subunit IIB [candidate division KSB1 bacterium]|nr:PTS sugar transporter subunit IIB [candidate division KSB1 bacterium]